MIKKILVLWLFTAFAQSAFSQVVLDTFQTEQGPIVSNLPANTQYVPYSTGTTTDTLNVFGNRELLVYGYQGLYDPATGQNLPSPAATVIGEVSNGVFGATFANVADGNVIARYSGQFDFTNGGAFNSFSMGVRMSGLALGAIEITVQNGSSSFSVGQALLSSSQSVLGMFAGSQPNALTNADTFVKLNIPFIDFSQWGMQNPYVNATGFSITLRSLPMDGSLYNTGNLEIQGLSVSAVPEPETYALMLAGLGLMGTVARRRKAKQA